MGKELKARLVYLEMKQRDLVKDLRAHGFSNMTEQLLSNIINGIYVGGQANSVLETADMILKEYEKKGR